MSSQEQQLNQINELQRFVHDTRRQAIYSQGNRSYRTEKLNQYYTILNASTQQLSRQEVIISSGAFREMPVVVIENNLEWTYNATV